MSKVCLLINYKNRKGEFASHTNSRYCCKRLVKELKKDPHKKELRHSIGGIHTMGKVYEKNEWIKRCPYCDALITQKKIRLDEYTYEFIQRIEIDRFMEGTEYDRR